MLFRSTERGVLGVIASSFHVAPYSVQAAAPRSMFGVTLMLATPTRSRMPGSYCRSDNNCFCPAVASKPPTLLSMLVNPGFTDKRQHSKLVHVAPNERATWCAIDAINAIQAILKIALDASAVGKMTVKSPAVEVLSPPNARKIGRAHV